jgi:hypothetical protein
VNLCVIATETLRLARVLYDALDTVAHAIALKPMNGVAPSDEPSQQAA